jgi:hypothetical protein
LSLPAVFTFPLKPGGILSLVAVWDLGISKSGGATLKVIPPARGSPHEYNGPPPGIFGGPAGSPVISITNLPLRLGSLTLPASALKPPEALDLVANPKLLFLVLFIFAGPACRFEKKKEKEVIIASFKSYTT